MSTSKRPSTSSLRRFITSRPYVPIAEIRRRFGIDDPDCMCSLVRNAETVFVGLPEREALKLQDLWHRQEIGLEMSVEVHARVVVGIYPMRIARYVMDGNGNGYHGNGYHANGHHPGGLTNGGGQRPADPARADQSADPARRPYPGSPATTR